MKKRTYTDKPLDDTRWLLEQWGSWRMSGMGVPRYTSPMLAVMRERLPMDGGVSYTITDDLALTVDGCIARLCQREAGRTDGPLMGDCIWLYFGAKWPAIRVGRHYGVSEMTAHGIIKAGVAWIDAALAAKLEAA